MKTKNDLKEMSAKDLNSEIAEMKKQLFELKMSAASGSVKDSSQFRKLRVAIAQAMTFCGQKKITKEV